MTEDEFREHRRSYDDRLASLEARQDQHLVMLNAFREESRHARAQIMESVETLSDRIHDLLDVLESLKRFMWVVGKITGVIKAIILPIVMIVGGIVSVIVYLKTGIWTGSGK